MIFIGFIPAKGHSRGLPGKNIIELMGKPLLAWSIEAGLAAPRISEVFVSTENDHIVEISKTFGVKTIIRPVELCADETSSEDVIRHALPFMQEVVGTKDFAIVLLQPTSPLRTTTDIEKSIEVFVSSGAHALVSVYPADSSLLKVYRQDDQGFLTGAFSPDAPYTPRQSLPKIYMPNGAIYIFTACQFLASGGIPRTKVVPFIMDEERSIDIDTQKDLDLAKKYMEKQHEPLA